MRFKLILAVSADGFLAKGPDDDMSWTGKVDKAIFRLLTTVTVPLPLLVGRKTAKAMPVQLPGRKLIVLSRNPKKGLDLRDAARAWPEAWLIGGAEVALQALELRLVQDAYLCYNREYLKEGIAAAPVLERLAHVKSSKVQLGDRDSYVQIFRGLNGP
jgi:dihydrofolate reductase